MCAPVGHSSEELGGEILSGERMAWARDSFSARCSACHGPDGEADEPSMNLVDEEWIHGGSLQEIIGTITEGVDGTLMKPQKEKLTPEEIEVLARFVLILGDVDHAMAPESELEEATRLTDEITPHLPPAEAVPVPISDNFIDDYIFGKMERDGVPHANLCTDAEFMRRVYFDLWGRQPDINPGNPIKVVDQKIELPNLYTVEKFLADPDPDKRDKLIDYLLGLNHGYLPPGNGPDYVGPWIVERPFVSKWTWYYCDLFNLKKEGGMNAFEDYIYFFVRHNLPYDFFVRDMLTATTVTRELAGPAGFILLQVINGFRCADIMHEDTCDEVAIQATKMFLGVDIECVSCHDGMAHLEDINLWLSKRKRVELWRQAAFFGNLRIFRPGMSSNDYTLFDGHAPRPDAIWQGAIASPEDFSKHFQFTSGTTELGGPGYRMEAPSVVRPPRNEKADVYPEYMLTKERPRPGVNQRAEFARMLTSDFQFAKATVNLFWSKLMTVGIVDPPFGWDLARQDPDNPPPEPWTIQPSHPELLDALASWFQANNYDLRKLMRVICRSKTYQLSSRFEGEYDLNWDRYYARKLVRRLSAEEVYDSMCKATNVFGHGVEYVMDKEGDPEGDLRGFLQLLREGGGNGKESGSVVQTALLLNSDVVERKTKADTEDSAVSKLLNQEPPLSNMEIVERLYLATLSRRPTLTETTESVRHIEINRDKGVEDVQWALINKLEFVVNY